MRLHQLALLGLLLIVGHTRATSMFVFSCFGKQCSESVLCNQTVSGFQLVPFKLMEAAPKQLFNASCDPTQTVCAKNNGVYRVISTDGNETTPLFLSKLLKTNFFQLPENHRSRRAPPLGSDRVIHINIMGKTLELIPDNATCGSGGCPKSFVWVTSIEYQGRVNFSPYIYTLSGEPTPGARNETAYMDISCYYPKTTPKPWRRRVTRCYPVKPN